MTRRRRAIAAGLWAALAAACGREAALNPETEARERFIRELAQREGLADTWDVMSRADLVFEDGFSLTEMVDPRPSTRWSELPPSYASVRAVAARWMGPAGHLRVRGRGGDMHLRIWGRTDVTRLMTRPRVTATFDGLEFYSRVMDEDGRFEIEAVIPQEWLRGWADVYVLLSSVHEPWRQPPNLKVARVEGVQWEPVR